MRCLAWPCLLLLVACGAPAPVGTEAPKAPDGPPHANVIVITVDTLRADRVGAWGYADAATPAIDGLAAAGVRFDAALTPQPRTTPGLGSFWTGLWPHHHAAREVGVPVALGTLWSEVLQGAGYVTRGVSSNAAASEMTNLHRGFDRFELRAGAMGHVITDLAIEVLEGVPDDARLLLWVHYLDPHDPYAPPARAGLPATPECAAAQARPRTELAADLDGLATDSLASCSDAYDHEIAYADTQIARLLDHLRGEGWLDKAFVVFASDHGEGLGERRLFYEHGPNVHDSNLHVPLSISGPGIAAGGVEATPVGLQDVAPTMTELLGLEAPDELDGRSLAPALRGEGLEPRPEFAESAPALDRPFPHALLAGAMQLGFCLHGPRFSMCWDGREDRPTLHERASDPMLRTDVSEAEPERYQLLYRARRRWFPTGAREHMVRDGRWKLVQRPRIEGGYARTLHDLEADPGEAADVSDAHPEIVERLGAALDAWVEALPHDEPAVFDEEMQAALRALGYLE